MGSHRYGPVLQKIGERYLCITRDVPFQTGNQPQMGSAGDDDGGHFDAENTAQKTV